MPASPVIRRRRRAAIDHDRNIQAGVLIECDLGELAGRAELRGGKRPSVRFRLGRGDDLLDGLFLAVLGDDVDERRLTGERNRREPGQRIVRYVAHDQPCHVMGRSVEQ